MLAGEPAVQDIYALMSASRSSSASVRRSAYDTLRRLDPATLGALHAAALLTRLDESEWRVRELALLVHRLAKKKPYLTFFGCLG